MEQAGEFKVAFDTAKKCNDSASAAPAPAAAAAAAASEEDSKSPEAKGVLAKAAEGESDDLKEIDAAIASRNATEVSVDVDAAADALAGVKVEDTE